MELIYNFKMGNGFSICDLCNRNQNIESNKANTYPSRNIPYYSKPNPFLKNDQTPKFHDWYKEL